MRRHLWPIDALVKRQRDIHVGATPPIMKTTFSEEKEMPMSQQTVTYYAVLRERGENWDARLPIGKAAPGQRPPASLKGRFCPLALAGLEPERTQTRLYAARATPTYRDESATSRCHFAAHSGHDPVSRAASALSPPMARAARSQCVASSSFPGHDQAVWHPRKLCSLARVGDGLTPS